MINVRLVKSDQHIISPLKISGYALKKIKQNLVMDIKCIHNPQVRSKRTGFFEI
jgi:hypothetical protein